MTHCGFSRPRLAGYRGTRGWFGAVIALICLGGTSCGGGSAGAPSPARASTTTGYWQQCDQTVNPNHPDGVTRCVDLRGQGTAPITTTEPISRACAEHDPVACKIRGRLISIGGLAAEPAAQRFGFLEAGCDHNDASSCETLGELFVDEGELDSAHAAFMRGCEYGSTNACLQLGQLLQRGEGCTRNRKMAARLFEQTCQRGVSRGCTLAADMYRQGWGVAFSPARAADLYQQACNQDNPRACRKLADLYRTGVGVAQSDLAADQLLERACGMGSANACADLHRHDEKAQPAATPAGLSGDPEVAPTSLEAR